MEDSPFKIDIMNIPFLLAKVSIDDLATNHSLYISYAAFLVGILTILVTALICWQVFNYVFIKREMNNIVKSALKDFQKDSIHVLKGMILIANSKSLFNSRFAQALDDTMISLEEVIKSKNNKLNKFAIEFLMDYLATIKKDMEERFKVPIIYEGKKDIYIQILKRTNHPDKDIFISMINKAEEIEENRNDNIRIVAENEINKKC